MGILKRISSGMRSLPDYYLYLLDPRGVIAKRIDLAGCRDDDHARGVAGGYSYEGDMELWQSARLVGRFAGVTVAEGSRAGRRDLEARAVYNLDKELRFISVNDIALEYWGRSRSEVIGRSLPDAFPNVLGSKPYKAHLQTLRSRRSYHGIVLSPVLAEAIDLEIHPRAEGLLVSFLKMQQAPAGPWAR